MRKRQLALHAIALFGVGVLLAACTNNQTSPAPPAAGPPKGGAPSYAPNTLAVACAHHDVYTYGDPDHPDLLRTITYDNPDIKSIAWDKSGNLFVGVNTATDSWVDEYPPGATSWSRHIKDGVHNPGFLATDDDGNLYVGNVGVLAGFGSVAIYPPGKSTKPAHEIKNDIPRLEGITVSRDPKYLWLSVHPFITEDNFRNYQLNSSTLVWVVNHDLSAPNLIEAAARTLYVANQGSNEGFVNQYDIAGEPKKTATFTSPVRHTNSLSAMTVDTDGTLYVIWFYPNPGSSSLYVWSKDGTQLVSDSSFFETSDMVATSNPGYFYSAEPANARVVYWKSGENFLKDKFRIDMPDHCTSTIKLALMR